MGNTSFVATAWNNGSWHRTGAGYGIKIPEPARDRFFNRAQSVVTLRLVASKGAVRIVRANSDKASFWDGTCRELISKEIGRWLIDNGLAPWPKGRPPKLGLVRIGPHEFEVTPRSPDRRPARL